MSIRSYLIAFSLFISFLLSFTSLYTVSYLLILVIGVYTTRPIAKAFSSRVAHFVSLLLLLSGFIMVAGLITWGLKLDALWLAPITIILSGLYGLSLRKLLGPPGAKHPFFLRSDLISLLLTFIAPLIIVGSYFAIEQNRTVSMYQFLSNGWDNGSHLNMMQNSSEADGYVYKKAENPSNPRLNSHSSDQYRSYPQGWHFSVAHAVDGLLPSKPLLNISQPMSVMTLYAVIYLVWFMLATFTFTRLSLHLLNRRRQKSLFTTDNLLVITGFIAANILIQMVVLWASIAQGFPNYLACIAYLMIISSIIVELFDINHKKTGLTQEKVALIATMIILSATIAFVWLLPLPATALMIILATLHAVTPKKPTLPSVWLEISRTMRGAWPLAITALATLFVLAVLLQLYIYRAYSSITTAQINEGTINGTFPVSTLFALLVIVIPAYVWIKKRQGDMFIAIVAPISILTAGIYAYQLYTAGVASYYFAKLLGLVLVCAGVFFTPTIASWIIALRRSFNLSFVSGIVLVVTTTGLFVALTDQHTKGLNFLSQTNSKVNYVTAEAITKHMAKPDQEKNRLVVLTGDLDQDRNGYFFTRLFNKSYLCTNFVVRSAVLSEQLDKLSWCLKDLASDHKDTHVTIITTPKIAETIRPLLVTDTQDIVIVK